MIQLVVISFLGLLTVGSLLDMVSADELNTGVVSKDTELFGKSYGEWAASWWQWFGSVPKDTNPGIDTTGENCGLGQNDSNIWYLIESFDPTKYVRDCTIPKDKYIFVPSLAAYCDTRLDNLESEKELVTCAQDYNEALTKDLMIKLDGKDLNSVLSYRVTSPITNFTYPENNIFDEPAYASQGVVDGYFVILEPLSIGNHELHIKTVALNPNKGAGGIGDAAYDVLYNLTVH